MTAGSAIVGSVTEGNGASAEKGLAPAEQRAVLLREIDEMARIAHQERLRETTHAYELALEVIERSTKLGYDAGRAHGLLTRGTCEGLFYRTAESMASLQEAIRLFESLGDEHGRIDSVISRSAGHSNNGAYREAVADAILATQMARKLKNATPLLIRSLSASGILHARLGEYPESLAAHGEALELAKAENDLSASVVILTGMGIDYQRLGDYSKSLECLFEANRLAVVTESSRQEATTLCNIGTTYGAIGQSSIALEYFARGLKLHEKNGNLRSQALVLKNISEQHNQIGEFSMALTECLRSLKLFQSIGDRQGQAVALRAIGSTLQYVQQYESAYTYLARSVSLGEELLEHHELLASLQALANLQTQLGQLEEATEVFERIVGIASAVDMRTLAHESLAKTYKSLGRAKESRYHREAYLELIREHYSPEQRERVKHLVAQFEYEQSLFEAERSGLNAEDMVEATDALRRASELKADTVTKGVMSAGLPGSDTRDSISSLDPLVTNFEVRTLGGFELIVDGKAITNEDWQRKKARDVFKILLLNYGRSVATEELIELVWPESKLKNPEPSLWNATSCIRRVLEPGMKSQMASRYIMVVDKTYRLDLGTNVTIDFHDFKSLVARAQSAKNDSDRRDALERAIDLYSGDFLVEDLKAEWSAFERMLLKEQYIDALMSLAKLSRREGNRALALKLATKVLEVDQTFETAYELVLGIYREEGQAADSAKLIERCKKAFKTELGSVPPHHLLELASQTAAGL